jgi:hypothetical protein
MSHYAVDEVRSGQSFAGQLLPAGEFRSGRRLRDEETAVLQDGAAVSPLGATQYLIRPRRRNCCLAATTWPASRVQEQVATRTALETEEGLVAFAELRLAVVQRETPFCRT